jgi:hypothetical protein
MSKHASLATEAVFSAWSVKSSYKAVFSSGVSSEVVVVVESWVEFWRWQSQLIEKKWQEMN